VVSRSVADLGRQRFALALATVAGCLAVFLLTGPPHVGDLAGQVARAQLFGRVGFVPWFAGWYAGIHPGGYSVVTPELMWWLGTSGVGAGVLVLTEALGYFLLRSGGARRPAAGAAALTVFQLADLLSGRTTFALGTVVLLGSLIALERDRPVVAGALGLIVSATSPTAGLFAVLIGCAYVTAPWLSSYANQSEDPLVEAARPRHLRSSVAMTCGTGVALLMMVRLFPDYGYEPFGASEMLSAALTSVVIAILPVGRLVRRGAAFSLVLVLGSFLVHSAIGSNAIRMALLLSAPAVIASLRAQRPVILCAAAALVLWPATQLHGDLSHSSDPASHQAFYAPLLTELRSDPAVRDQRVEVIEPRNHWQVAYMVPTVTLARGWQRQLDTRLNAALYSSRLTSAQYRAFLDRNAVALVAAPQHTRLDFGSYSEGRLVRSGLSYLHVIWSNRNWNLYAVLDPSPVASGDGSAVTALTQTGLRLTTTGAGTVHLHLRYSPYLVVTGGSVHRDANGQVVLQLTRAGPHDLHAVWSFGGILHALI
jgi:predicted small integral membrane protein